MITPTRLAAGDPERIKLLLALLLSLRGAAFLYQGDELGLPHAEVPFGRLRDPEAITFWPSGIGRDGARTPMPWLRDAPMAGFTSAHDAWLPLDPRHRALAVDAQEKDANSVLAFAQHMIAVRKQSEALRIGDIKMNDFPGDLLVFERRSGANGVLCAFNLGSGWQSFPWTGTERSLLSIGGASVAQAKALLPGFSALLLAV